MKMCRVVQWWVLLGMLLPSAWAQAGGPKRPPPKPLPALQQLHFFLGDWKCDGKVAAGPQGPERTFKTKAAIRNALDRFWYEVTYTEERVKDGPPPRDWHGFWGFDPSLNQFFRASFSNLGEWTTGSATGWTGDEWEWNGEVTNAAGEKLQFKHTFTKVDEKAFSDRFEVNQDGTWKEVITDTCKR